MRGVLRATAALSASSVVRIGVGLVTMKVWALVVGPAGLGEYGVLQGLVGVAALVAALGGGTGVVRLGAAALGRGDEAGAAVVGRVAVALAWLSGGAAAGALWLLREPVGRYVLDGTAPWVVGLMGVAVLLTVVAGAETGVINAYHRIGALSRMGVASTVAGGAVAVGVLVALGRPGVPWAVVAGAAVTLAVTGWYRRREGLRLRGRWRRTGARAAATALLRFGLPYTAAALVGTGVTMVLPFVVLHVLGVDAVGQYRAAVGVSFGYVGFLLTALAMDYYPRLSGLGGAAGLSAMVNEQLRLLLLAGGAVVLVAQATAPLAVPVLYSAAFAPAVPVLEWQLAGTIFRFWSYAFSFVVLARGTSAAFFAVEAVFGAALLGGTWAGVSWLGLPGAGVGFLAAYVVYGAVVWAYVGRTAGVRAERSNVALLGVLAALSLGVGATTGIEGVWTRAGAAAVLVGGYAAYAGRALYRAARRPEAAPPEAAPPGTAPPPVETPTPGPRAVPSSP